jgi:glycosyltransferase involved in cell wall biosynthesis
MILFIHTIRASFVMTDLEILSKHSEVQCFQYPLDKLGKKLMSHIRCQLALLIFLSKNILRADCLYIWFADYHAFLPVLFGKVFKKRILLILGGYDVTYIPELKYGSFSNPLRILCTRFALRYASMLLPVHSSLADEVRQRVKKINGRIIPLSTGYYPQHWYCDQIKKDTVLTVGNINSLQTYRRKGIDFFIAVAERCPQYQFHIIGLSQEIIDGISLPHNVIPIGFLPRTELRLFYARAKVYVQFSVYEGLPNVLCEAMLCECIPVGSTANGIPDAIGDCGYILKEKTVQQACTCITAAMATGQETAKRARQRIIDHFSISARENFLVSLIQTED